MIKSFFIVSAKMEWYGHVLRKDDDDDLHLKLSDDVDCSEWREMMRGNWSDSYSDSDAVSWLGITGAGSTRLTWIKRQ